MSSASILGPNYCGFLKFWHSLKNSKKSFIPKILVNIIFVRHWCITKMTPIIYYDCQKYPWNLRLKKAWLISETQYLATKKFADVQKLSNSLKMTTFGDKNRRWGHSLTTSSGKISKIQRLWKFGKKSRLLIELEVLNTRRMYLSRQ